MIDALAEMIAHPGPLRARRAGSLPGARPADDPGGHDRAGYHQELTRPGQIDRARTVASTGAGSRLRVRSIDPDRLIDQKLYFFIFL